MLAQEVVAYNSVLPSGAIHEQTARTIEALYLPHLDDRYARSSGA